MPVQEADRGRGPAGPAPPADSRSEPVLHFLLAGGTTAQIVATLGITQEEVALRIMRRLRPLPPPDLAAAQ